LRGRERIGDFLDELWLLELASRDVDRHAQPAPLAAPCGGLLACGTQHPAPERHDHSGLLGQRDELVRRDDATGWMAQKSLDFVPTDGMALEHVSGLITS